LPKTGGSRENENGEQKKKEGSAKEFSRKVKHESRQQPKTVLETNSAARGIGDAGQALWMFV
jgi:hypothetical protein